MLKVVERPKPAPEMWEKILLTRELEPFYEWLGVPDWYVLGFIFPVGIVVGLYFLIKFIRKKINKNCEVGYHDRGY